MKAFFSINGSFLVLLLLLLKDISAIDTTQAVNASDSTAVNDDTITTQSAGISHANIAVTTQTMDSDLGSTVGTGANSKTQTKVSPSTKQGTSVESTDRWDRLWQLLQQLGTVLPELRNVIMLRQRPTPQQTQQLMSLAKQLRPTLSALPSMLQGGNSTADLIKFLATSDLLKNLTSSAFPSGATRPPETKVPPTSSKPYTVDWLKCQADLFLLGSGLVSREMWALQMLDSWGKPEHSILRGNLVFLGNNEECRSVHYKNTSTFANVQGNMCRMSITMDFGANLMPGNEGPTPLVIDVCLPRSCQSADLNKALNENGASFAHGTCTADLDISTDHWAVVAIIILSIFIALMVAGTLTEFCVGSKTRRRSEFINAFINSNSSSNMSNGNGVITSNGSPDKLRGNLNDGFEMREVGHITAGKDVRHRTSVGNPGAMESEDETEYRFLSNGVKNRGSIQSVSTEQESAVSHRVFTDDFPSFYPFQKNVSGRGCLAEPFSSLGGRNTPASMRHQTKVRQAAEGREKPKDDTAHLAKWQRLLLAFSLPRNTGKILGVKAGPGAIGCLHGIRVLSMGWVILGHVIIFGAGFNNFQNRADIYDLMPTLLFQTIMNAPLSVDTFFFMSGLLTAYLFLKECGKSEKVTVKQGIMYYVHRYWRLTPPMLIWIMVVACIIQYVGEGRPGWTDFSGAKICRESWWLNMLYIQNLYIEKSGCLGVTWYLANDMQFYILAPLVMIPWVYKQRILGDVMAAMLITVHLASNAWLVYEYNFDVIRRGELYGNKLYVRPWARVGPFAIGLVVGYILYRTKCKMHINKYLVALGWFLAIGAMLTITLVTYDENKDITTDFDGWPVEGKIVYEMLSRPAWAVVLGWIVLACVTGHGGFINSILSWEGFLPLSRLTYCAYLIHMTILNYEFFNADSTFFYSVTNLIYRFFGMYVMSYAVAFLLAVGVEAPMLGLEKVLLSH